MTEQILNALCRSLEEEFELPVYTERIVQNISCPCFAVRLERVETERFFGKKSILRTKFRVICMDDSRSEHGNAVSTVERLCGAVKLLDYGGGKVHGSGIKCEFNENRLELTVNYDIFVYEYGDDGEETGLMQEYDIDWEV